MRDVLNDARHRPDNVTHSLIGYALARATTHERSVAEQRAGIWTSVGASNAPDLDFAVNFFSEHSKLNYLAHHRGQVLRLGVVGFGGSS